jgi:hypothetical protein
MSEIPYPSWQEPVSLAVIEIDPQKLKEKIAAARQAIEVRRAQLNGNCDSRDERIALDDAMRTLQLLERDSAAGKR